MRVRLELLCYVLCAMSYVPHLPDRRLQEGRWGEALASLPLITCQPDSPFKEAINQLVDHHKHRCLCVRGVAFKGVLQRVQALLACGWGTWLRSIVLLMLGV
jgi:hypothetical protein